MVHVFDIDNTLINTKAKVRLINVRSDEVIAELSSQEYNNFSMDEVLGADIVIDFSEFNSLPMLLKEEKTILWVALEEAVANKDYVYIITARGDSNLISTWLSINKTAVPRENIFCYGEPVQEPFNTSSEVIYRPSVRSWKAEVLANIIKHRFDDIKVYEDDKNNIEAMRSVLQAWGGPYSIIDPNAK